MAMEFLRSSRRILESSGCAIALIFLLFIHGAHSFYLPGVAPQDFEKVKTFRICASRLLDLIWISWICVSISARINPFLIPEKARDSESWSADAPTFGLAIFLIELVISLHFRFTNLSI